MTGDSVQTPSHEIQNKLDFSLEHPVLETAKTIQATALCN